MLEALKNKITLGDSFEILKKLPDKCIDLILTDPPYGLKFGEYNRTNKLSDGTRYKANKYKNSNWDDSTPSDEFFLEMFRVSKNQIIFGGNYFPILWQYGGKGFIFWNKNQPVKNFADGELAWTSFDRPAKNYNFTYYGNLEGNTVASDKIHPTQKPLKLFEMILRDYVGVTEEKHLVADFFSGSGTTAVACWNLGFDFIAVEKDEEYYKSSVERLENVQSQMKLFRGLF
jgi:site-specific DNA-methyltransferase (adenine-specific)